MTRTQIQLPEPLFGRLCSIAQTRHVSVAELIRQEMELYAMSCSEVKASEMPWTMPVLRGSGGHRMDPASAKVEASTMVGRFHSK